MSKKNSVLNSVVCILCLAFLVGAINADEAHNMVIDIDSEIADGKEVTVFKLNVNGEDAHISNLELAEGESYQFMTESGKEIIITKGNGEYNIKIDGENIEESLLGFQHELADVNVDVNVQGDHKEIRKFVFKGGIEESKLMVIGKVSKEEKLALNDALKAIGSSKELDFMDDEVHAAGVHGVKIIKLEK